MAALDQKTIIQPTLADTLTILKTDIFQTMNCVKIGQIQSFNANAKTAQVQILFKRVLPDNSITDYPVLLDVPVLTPQGGGGALQFPIEPGDNCLLLFSDRNIDAWFKNGSAAAPFDARLHDLSDAIAIVGLNSLASNLAANPTATVRLSYAGAKVDLNAGLVHIANNTTSLLTLLQQLAVILESATIDTTHGVFTGTTIAALTNWALSLAELLQ